MKSIWKSRMLKFALGSLLAVCGNTGVARAEDTLVGKFTLPFATEWQNVTLPAGNYAFRMNGPDKLIRIFQDDKVVGIVVTYSHDYVPQTGAMSLTVAQYGRKSTVRELSLASIGEVFHFPGAKPTRGSAAERESIQLVPIAITSK